MCTGDMVLWNQLQSLNRHKLRKNEALEHQTLLKVTILSINPSYRQYKCANLKRINSPFIHPSIHLPTVSHHTHCTHECSKNELHQKKKSLIKLKPKEKKNHRARRYRNHSLPWWQKRGKIAGMEWWNTRDWCTNAHALTPEMVPFSARTTLSTWTHTLVIPSPVHPSVCPFICLCMFDTQGRFIALLSDCLDFFCLFKEVLTVVYPCPTTLTHMMFVSVG